MLTQFIIDAVGDDTDRKSRRDLCHFRRAAHFAAVEVTIIARPATASLRYSDVDALLVSRTLAQC